MKYGVVIFPSKSLQDKANSYRKRYDSHYALIPPHLTLKSSFVATDTEARELAGKLQTISEKHNPFTLKTIKISSFYPANNVIYLKVEPSSFLEKLHQEINGELKIDDSNGYAFVPHITIGQDLSDDEHSDVYGSLRMINMEHEETVDRFHLLYQLENGQWTVYETFRLGKEV